MKQKITLTINGKTYSDEVEPRLLLIHYLREVAGLTGPHIGCETSICGACTVMLDGMAVKSCTMFAVQAEGLTSSPSKAWRRTAISIPCSRRSGTSTPSSAAFVLPDDSQRQPIASDPIRTPPNRRSATGSKATCAAAPATSTSSTPSKPRRKREEHNHGHHNHQTANYVRQAPPPPGRSAPDHRHGALCRRSEDARHASRHRGAQPLRRSEHQVSTPKPRSPPPAW